MVAYYAMTKFHLLFSMTHKMLFRKDKKGILFLYSGMSGVSDYKDKILECECFEEVYIVNEIELRLGWTGVSNPEKTELMDANIRLISERVDEWIPVRLQEMDEIYIANDHWALGIYCIYNHIYYNYYEDGVGMLSKPDYSYDLVFNLNKTQAYIAKYIGAFGNNEYVLKKYADLNNQSEGFNDEKACHYSVKESLEKLSNEEIHKILYIFNAPNIEVGSGKCTLIFTEHFVNMKRLSIDEQSEIYTLLCDYFCGDNKLLVKPHPSDIHTNYEKLLPGSVVISKEFPSELLPFCMNGEKDLGLAACSTAVLGLQDYFQRIVRFDIDIENTYTKFHKYYAISNLLVQRNIKVDCKIGVIETHLLQFTKLAIYDGFSRLQNSRGITATLVDSLNNDDMLDEDLLNSTDCVIFTELPLSDKLGFEFWNNCKLEHLMLLRIKKECFVKCYLTNCEEEYVFIYAKEKRVINYIGGLSYMKELPYSGAKVNIDTISSNDTVKIKFLEAVLESTNKKLQYYIDREKELLGELNKKK